MPAAPPPTAVPIRAATVRKRSPGTTGLLPASAVGAVLLRPLRARTPRPQPIGTLAMNRPGFDRDSVYWELASNAGAA
jgi:hypothetical protein